MLEKFGANVLKEGYRLPFGQYPSPCFHANNKSLLEHPQFLQQLAILELQSMSNFAQIKV